MQAEQNNVAGELFLQLREYIALQVRIMRLQLVNQVARKSASGIAFLIFIVLSVAIFGILSLSAGFYLGSLFNSVALGFLTLGGFYILVLAILIIFREPLIKRPLRNSIIRSLLKS